jgi:hypothetical protein
MRRCNEALYFSDEIIEKLRHRDDCLSLADFADIFFPVKTNEKQHNCTLKLFQALDKQGVLENKQLKHLYPTTNERMLFLSHVLPKLERFEFIKSTKEKGSKKYRLYFFEEFSYCLAENLLTSHIIACRPKRKGEI